MENSADTIDYVEIYVTDLESAVQSWINDYGFAAVGTAGSDDLGYRSVALRLGSITLVLTMGISPDHPASDYVAVHGDGVGNIALHLADPPSETRSVRAFGDVIHTLVEHQPGLPPGFAPLASTQTEPADIALIEIDHIAVCLGIGDLNPTVEYYENELGFREIFAERIVVGSQAMNSKVVQSPGRGITLTLIEPDASADPGQIDDFLKNHNGAGVQHLAFSTADAVRTVRAYAFFPPPASTTICSASGSRYVATRWTTCGKLTCSPTKTTAASSSRSSPHRPTRGALCSSRSSNDKAPAHSGLPTSRHSTRQSRWNERDDDQ
jgi:4-hydroxyphenylpyruvate dioxygenase-like putative hemolysin